MHNYIYPIENYNFHIDSASVDTVITNIDTTYTNTDSVMLILENTKYILRIGKEQYAQHETNEYTQAAQGRNRCWMHFPIAGKIIQLLPIGYQNDDRDWIEGDDKR